jgi:acyl CoA:acetate/3-ketoacid CoA transferase beta subunit
MQKLERTYSTAYSTQNICKHCKKKSNAHFEEEMAGKECSFRKGQSCVDAIFTTQQIIEKRT